MTPPRPEEPCSSCGAAPTPGARFCSSCGAALRSESGAACPACQTANPNHAQFCFACGAPLSSVAEADRRIVTVLFADLSGFTQLTEQLDAEEVRGLVADCLARLSDCVTRWGGYVDKFIGDCVMALFGAPLAYENEEERAVLAALDMQTALKEWAPVLHSGYGRIEYRPELTIGINTGPVVTGVFAGGSAQNYTAVGDTVNVASRLEGQCDRGRVLVGAATYDATGHLFEFDEELTLKVKGRREPVHARHVIGLRAERARVRGFKGRHAPLIGRDRELMALREQWKSASAGAFQLRLVTGPAGIGKTRLVEELIDVEGLTPDKIATGRSYPYASSTPWEPIVELIRSLHDLRADLAPSEAATRVVRGAAESWPAERVAGLKVALGSPLPEVPELQSYSVAERGEWIRNGVAGALRTDGKTPRLLVLEDLHWADRTTLEFLADLPELGLPGPILMVLVSRPPLPGESLLTDLFDAIDQRIELVSLLPDDARALIDALLEVHQLPEDLTGVIIERAEGNPFFIEETLKSLEEKGALRSEGGTWLAESDFKEVEIPGSIESLMSTRIDGLDSSTKQVLQYAAIVGRRFWSGVLADALARRPVDRELDDLTKGAFVRDLPHSAVHGDREFMFEHLLLHESAYEGMLRGLRTDLHGAVAAWFEEHLGERGGEFDDWVAFHYERSNEPERALPYLERAAQGARGRGALADASSLIERALAVASSPGDKARLLPLAEEIALAQGDGERRLKVIEDLEALATVLDDIGVAAEASYRRARYQLDAGDLEDALSTGEAALKLFEKLGDISLQGDALRLLGRVSHVWGDYPSALRFYRSSLEMEQQAGDRYGQAEIFDRLGLVQVDLGNYTTAIDYFRAARDICAGLGDRPNEARVLAHESTAHRWLGCHEEAEAAARAGLELAKSCGSRQAEASAELNLAMAMASHGATDEARALQEDVVEVALAQLHRPAIAARATLVLAQIETGPEARKLLRRARQLGRESGLTHIEILSLAQEAKLDLDDGDLEAAEKASAESMRLLEFHFNIQGSEESVLYTRAAVLSARGRDEEARELLKRARTIVSNKADRIEDPNLRRRYEEVSLNQVILESAGNP